MVVGVSGDGKKEHGDRTKQNARDEINKDKVNSDSVKTNNVIQKKNNSKLFKSKKTVISLDFFIIRTRLAFTKLK